MELGRAIGQESMLTGQPPRITVEAESDVLVLRMSVANFSSLLMRRPDVVQRIEMLSYAR
jgi:CRP-like cAMP-binding protein